MNSFLQKPKMGFLLGKFYPPHQGHVFMCEFARQYCEELTILVCSMDNETIPGHLRYQWMKEMFPDCNVIWEKRDLPQEPNGPDDVEFWAIWKQVVYDAMKRVSIIKGYEDIGQADIDVVFASEDYGHRLAAEVGARFVPVDITRTARTVSGTAIRNDPFDNWEFIPHVVRPHFVKRVCVFGPESTGKSTLARNLARSYHTIVAPEYGRTYTETFGAEVGAQDLQYIVHGHLASVAAAKRQANRILIEDTDPVMTAVWSDMLTGERHPWFAEFTDHADLYLLCGVNVPWIDDGTRYFPKQEERDRFFKVCRDELDRRQVAYAIIDGDNWVYREVQATWAINKHFGIKG